MKKFLTNYWKTLLFFAVMGLLGGFFIGIYLLESYPEDIRLQVIEELNTAGLGQFPVDILIGVITAIQAAGYGIVLGAIGILLSKKIGLWNDRMGVAVKPLLASVFVAFVSGLAMVLLDLLFFGRYSDVIIDSYATKPTITYILGSIIYGGVIEEVMLRLFCMSLIAFVLHKLFQRNRNIPTTAVFVIANIFSALLFAAGHLPATAMLMGVTPMIIFRCFLLNGVIGLLFGRLYRKHGLQYAMLAHGGSHLVSKLIWILFI